MVDWIIMVVTIVIINWNQHVALLRNCQIAFNLQNLLGKQHLYSCFDTHIDFIDVVIVSIQIKNLLSFKLLQEVVAFALLLSLLCNELPYAFLSSLIMLMLVLHVLECRPLRLWRNHRNSPWTVYLLLHSNYSLGMVQSANI